ncbi:ATP-binding protein [Mucilaginibacter xinganensis]|uniref:ATP-binding protein n=1 Tax=Mucilaginibacter xinganensis TaxID=1234841 RepID=A0A223P348_9SPHI|nr:ATP-binding protein [Mucilaginibacter xinganensis]ASU36535.1 ATP-binding protein [Mucilaginibacter xinganensis]
MENLNNYKFEPGARSIIQMGEELIGHPTTAINELVKNGYDADATDCKVYVNYHKDNSKSFVAISDNGLGMNSKTLFGDWLQPSVSHKRLGNSKSKIFQRNFLGSKGIGRLAAMALGRYLTVITKTSDESDYNWLVIDRQDFKAEALLSHIEFPGGSSNSANALLADERVIKKKNGISNNDLSKYLLDNKLTNFKEGTIIIVEELDDSIKTIVEDEFLNGDTEIQNIDLIQSLKILITPLILNSVIQDELINKNILEKKYEIATPESTFELFFGCNLIRSAGDTRNFIKIEEYSILSNFDYRVLGKVSKDGSINGLYYCNRLIEDSFNDSFVLSRDDVFSTEYLRTRNIDVLQDINNTNKVGEFYFDIRVFDRDPDALDKLAKLLGAPNRRSAGYLLDDIVGLRVSKDGFGVKPYGDEGNDWMELGQMRVQNPTAVIGTNQLIGNIFLFSPENDSLSEKTNREGFFENEAFITFKKMLRSILLEVGKKRYNYRQKHGLGRKAISKHDRPDSSRFLDFIKKITQDETVISQAEVYLNEISTTLDNLENSLSFSQRLATLGSGLELVYHEMSQPIMLIGKCLFSMKFPVGRINKLEDRNEILSEMTGIKSAIATLDHLKESLQPAIGISRKSNFKPVDTFDKVCYLLTKDFITYNISVDIDDNIREFKINDHEYHLWISFLNILNNSIYWLKSVENDERKILFKKGIDNELIISNNGPKIEIGELENIFNYGVTHKKVKNATGLGLAYTRSLLSTNNWEIWCENYDYGPAFILKPLKP